MCGIFGSFGLIDQELLLKAIRLMKHRGPDSRGKFIDRDVMLGMTRLSTIDLKKGDQPIYNEDKSIVVVFNGEIYNYLEIRKTLEKKQHRFYTDSDTEVLVHCYEEYGENFVSLLNGMFSIALWDSNKKNLFLYRDRFGIKPLYYYSNENYTIFSSEINPILSTKEVDKEFNSDFLYFYLKYRYFPNPNTFIKEIKKVRPGCYLKISDKNIVEKKYYSIKLDEIKKKFSKEKLNKEIKESVRKRLMSDVPLGLFLSGGVDSGTILHHMSKSSDKIKTFTMGYEDDKNEYESARVLSERYDTEHHEFKFDLDSVIKHIPKMFEHLEEPIADATAMSSFLLAKKTSKYAKVVLSGEGADEIFQGYIYYKNMNLFKTYTRLGKIGTPLIKKIPIKLLNYIFQYPDGLGKEGKKRLIEIFNKTQVQAYDTFISLFDETDFKKLRTVKKNKIRAKNYSSIYDTMIDKDLNYWLPDYILTRVDKMSMAHSLEVRVPFLDHNLVDYAIKHRIPDGNKKLIRQLIRAHLPETSRRKKHPFHIPIIEWFDKGLKDYYESIFDESILIKDKILNKNLINSIIEKHKSSKLINSRKLWSLLTLEHTYKRYNYD